MAVSAAAAGVASSCGVQPGPLATIGTSSFCEAATPASDAACGGAAENRIPFTPARRNAATWPVMSVSAGVIFCSAIFRPCLPAAYLEPFSAFSP